MVGISETITYWEMVALAAIVAGLYALVACSGLVSALESTLRQLRLVGLRVKQFCISISGLVALPKSEGFTLLKPNMQGTRDWLAGLDASRMQEVTEDENEPEHVTPEEQWQRVTTVVSSSIESARVADKMHDSAGRQLDAVDYEYLKMLDELAALMPQVITERVKTNKVNSVQSIQRPTVEPMPSTSEDSSIAA